MNIVIPHFERYPLRAKKARDFLIWKQGIQVAARVVAKGKVRLKTKGGFARNWTDQGKAEFRARIGALRGQRQFDAPEITPPQTKLAVPETKQDWLFDL